MVEKVSEASAKVEVNIDSSSDDTALLKWIEKKKKNNKGAEHPLTEAILPPATLVRLLNASAIGGGLQKTEQQAVKHDVPASFGRGADSLQPGNGGSLRRQAVLAAAGHAVKIGPVKQNAAALNDLMANTLSTKNVAVVQKVDPLPGANTLLASAAKIKQSVAVQQTLTVPAANLGNVNIQGFSVPQVEPGHLQQRRMEEDRAEVRPVVHGAKQAERVLPQQVQTAQSKNVPATLQLLKTQASAAATDVKQANESQTLEVDYQFQRWSGNHSVKISVPIEARREGNVTLLPSDARAADVLLRNMGHLAGQTPDLLWPQQEQDEQQQRRQQQQQDEEQE